MAAETKKATADLSAKLRTQKLRTAVAAAVFAVMAAGHILGVSTGTMSGFGWESIPPCARWGRWPPCWPPKPWCPAPSSAWW